MLPHVGTTCQYTLTQKFSTLSGVYNTLSIMTFEAAITNGVDFTNSLYAPAGLQQSDYIADYASYKGTNVIEVSPVADSSITYYFPEGILALNPDPTVVLYHDVYYAVRIGMFKDPNSFAYVKSMLDDIVASVTGKANAGKWLANPENDTYLTEAQYATMDAARQADIKAVAPLTTQIQDQKKLIVSLQSQISALQKKLIDLGS